MMKPVLIAAIVACIAASGAPGSAFAFSDRVKKACAGDYQNYCSQYVPESSAARRCFESNRRSLTKPCVAALIDAGEVPAKYLRK